jgi:RNA polymerase sigma-70 factor (ECF subfamily)
MRKAVRLAGRRRPKSLFVAAREDLEAFEHVYDEYADSILVYLARRTLDPEVAFDLMAETFAEAFDDIGTFRGSTDEEGRAWLYAIATHLLMRWRKRGEMERRKMNELGISTRDLGQEEFERIETLADLQRLKPVLDGAMRRLSDDQRRVLQLRIVEDRSYEEIADELGTSNQAVRHHASRALRQLAVTLGQFGTLKEEIPPAASKELIT